jgi:amidophosphoribosyltransferase
MSTREEMIAHGRTVEQIAAQLGCDSLHYLSLESVYDAVGATPERHCDACFSGRYPLEGSAEANGKYALERDAQPAVRDQRRAARDQYRSSRAPVASL